MLQSDGVALSWSHYVICLYAFKGYSVVIQCMTESNEESKQNRPFSECFFENVSLQEGLLIIEKNNCTFE